MTRRFNAGHAGAQGKKHRCKDCGHRPGPRVLEYSKQAKGKAEPRKQHKKFCDHECHRVVR